ncbi:MAG: Zn-dependent hydrolase [Kordiimonadaceae bacterium]|nr:Zn-dependent hydrolase [Kordiimonadaceae bacterium]
MPNISVKRIEEDLFALSKFGYNKEDKGVYRQGFTDTDMAARKWLMDLFEENGLKTRMDGAGNVIGRYGEIEKPAVIIGSHLDSVPAGGIFDGTLGVMAGLECIRTIKENSINLDYPVDIIATSEEEGRFGGMLGSQAITGSITLDWLEQAKDSNGEMLKDAMAKYDLNYLDVLHAYRDKEDIKAFLELHVEQGPVLENTKKTIGVVDGISGVFKWLVRLIGKADHAGTAPMNMRSDAFLGVADFAHEIQRIIDEEGTDKSRITIGHLELKPGFPHTVPGEVDFSIVGRDLDPDVMKSLANACRRVLSSIARRHRLMFEYEEMSWLEPKYCDKNIVKMIEKKAKDRGYSYLNMPSGAGHDAQFFTDITPTGLIFVPSVGGISHAPDEWTHWIDVERGSNLLLDCLIELSTD